MDQSEIFEGYSIEYDKFYAAIGAVGLILMPVVIFLGGGSVALYCTIGIVFGLAGIFFGNYSEVALDGSKVRLVRGYWRVKWTSYVSFEEVVALECKLFIGHFAKLDLTERNGES